MRSVIEGDRRYGDNEEQLFGSYGYSRQEVGDDGLIDVQEEPEDDSAASSDFHSYGYSEED